MSRYTGTAWLEEDIAFLTKVEMQFTLATPKQKLKDYNLQISILLNYKTL